MMRVGFPDFKDRECDMFPEVVEIDGILRIPVYGTNEVYSLTWGEDQSWEDVGPQYPYDFYEFEFLDAVVRFEVYQVTDKFTEKRYFLISYNEIIDFEDIFHTVCLPFNRINLYRFVTYYLAPSPTSTGNGVTSC